MLLTAREADWTNLEEAFILVGMSNQTASVGQPAPSFALEDQFGRLVELANFRGRANIMLVFYPLDWTPT